MNRSFKLITRFAVAACLAAQGVGAQAQSTSASYPEKPIKLIVGVPPGGSTDAFTRVLAQWLQESLGQPTIVDNRPGANTAVAADTVARSAPDGYTILVASDAYITLPLLTRMYDPFKDFEPISTISVSPFVFVVHPSTPIKSVVRHISKSLTNGMHASAGVTGALMAASGLEGHEDIFGAPFGVLHAWGADGQREAVAEGLGESYAIMGANFKFINAGYPIHAAVEAAMTLVAQHEIALDAIASVDVGMPSTSMKIVDNRDMHNICLQDMLTAAPVRGG